MQKSFINPFLLCKVSNKNIVLPKCPDGKIYLFVLANNFVLSKNMSIKKQNKASLPGKLKAGIENLSGCSMDDVIVHFNTVKPEQLKARAFAQGTNIHIAPGQEKHLTHEAWHVVQQEQSRMQPPVQLKDNPIINDDKWLEKEADDMGAKAAS